MQLFLNKLRYVRASLNGDALKSMGILPGPHMGEILRLLRDARLDGRIKTREGEEELARLWIRGQI